MQVKFFVPVIIKGGANHLGYYEVTVKQFLKVMRLAKNERGFYGVDVSIMHDCMGGMRNYYLRSETEFEYGFFYEEN